MPNPGGQPSVPVPSRQIDGSAAGVAFVDDRVVFVRGKDSNLWATPVPDFAQPEPSIPIAGRRQVDGNVSYVQVLDDQIAFVLGRDGNLWATPVPSFANPQPSIPIADRRLVDSSVAGPQSGQGPDGPAFGANIGGVQ
jgi:hypothetical protein